MIHFPYCFINLSTFSLITLLLHVCSSPSPSPSCLSKPPSHNLFNAGLLHRFCTSLVRSQSCWPADIKWSVVDKRTELFIMLCVGITTRKLQISEQQFAANSKQQKQPQLNCSDNTTWAYDDHCPAPQQGWLMIDFVVVFYGLRSIAQHRCKMWHHSFIPLVVPRSKMCIVLYCGIN